MSSMSSNFKKSRLAEPEEAFGYLHSVSPMKTSAKGYPYFNAKIQECSNVTDIVGYKDKIHVELKQMEIKRSPVKLSNIDRVLSFRNPGTFDIKLKNRSVISPTKLEFPYEKPHEATTSCPHMTIAEIEDIPQGSKVSLTAKVVEKHESVEQLLRNNKTMMRTSFSIADHTAAISLTLWGPPEQLAEGSTYIFTNLTVKMFETKKVSTSTATMMKKTQNLENMVEVPIFQQTEVSVKINAVNLITETACGFCNDHVSINEQLNSVKCSSCGKRMLKEMVKKKVKCTINVTTEEGGTREYVLSAAALDSFVPSDLESEDKELFLLTNNEVKIIVGRDTNIITNIDN